MYKFNTNGIEENIKYIKPGSFFKQVSSKLKKAFEKSNEKILEESTVSAEDLVKNEEESLKKIVEEAHVRKMDFTRALYTKINKALNKEEKKKEIIYESYNPNLFEEKGLKDLVFISSIIEEAYEGFPEKYKEELYEMTKSLMMDVIDLYKEANVKPRYLSPSLMKKEISENEIIRIYKDNMKKFLNENYLKPLMTEKFNETYKNDIKKVTKLLTENGVDVNLDELMLYYPFEKTLQEFFESVLIPEPAKIKIKYFEETQNPEYFEFFDRNVRVLQESIEDKISKIISLIAPFLFNKTVETEEDINPIKYAGVSIVCKKVNDGPMICHVREGNAPDVDEDVLETAEEELQDEAEADLEDVVDQLAEEDADDSEITIDDESVEDTEDKDNDGIPDKEEDHGELPEDFKGDHEDAEKLKEKESKKDKKELKETTEEPGASETIPYDRKKALNEADKEEIVKDEADNVNSLDDAAKEEK